MMALPLALAGLTVLAVSSCRFVLDLDKFADNFAIGGTAAGLDEPVMLTLQVEGDSEMLTVSQDGPFAFETVLPDGALYQVEMVEGSGCQLVRGTGVIDGQSPDIEINCPGMETLTGLSLLGPRASAIEVAPLQFEYPVPTSMLHQETRVTASWDSEDLTVTIAGNPASRGVQSAPLALTFGSTTIDVEVAHTDGWQRTYQLVVDRDVQLIQDAYGKASNTGVDDLFGRSVSISGDTMVIGAIREDSDGNTPGTDTHTNSGAAYVFRRVAGSWSQEALLKASTVEDQDLFGVSVSISGDTIAVGAREEDGGADNSGAVYVFRRNGMMWEQEAYLKPDVIGANDFFGVTVSLSGDGLAVGALHEDSNATGVDGEPMNDSAMDSGAVYMFRRTGTNWRPEAYLKASNTDPIDRFGINLSLSGDYLAVSATYEDGNGESEGGDNSTAESGAVYVFHRTGEGWSQQAYIKASNVGSDDSFGSGVALHDDLLVVGAFSEDSSASGVGGNEADDSAQNSGAVYVFRRDGTDWPQEAYIKATNTGANDLFGHSVAVLGDTIAVGAWGEGSIATGIDGDQNDDGASKSGAVYLLQHDGMEWSHRSYVKASNTGANDQFGFGLALSSDTLVVCAPEENGNGTGINMGDPTNEDAMNSGAMYIFH